MISKFDNRLHAHVNDMLDKKLEWKNRRPLLVPVASLVAMVVASLVTHFDKQLYADRELMLCGLWS